MHIKKLQRSCDVVILQSMLSYMMDIGNFDQISISTCVHVTHKTHVTCMYPNTLVF